MEILSMTGNKKKTTAAIAFCMLIFAAFPLHAQSSVPTQLYEQKVKAGLVYNFLKSTSWPQNDKEKNVLRVCLYGADPFDGYLYPLEGRTAQQHVITITHTTSPEKIESCNALFVHRDQEEELPVLLESLQGKSILTLSDMEDFSKRGGMVEFSTEEDRRVHLLINKDAVESAGLGIQQSLLKLAKLVE